jgi:hypothetical protein
MRRRRSLRKLGAWPPRSVTTAPHVAGEMNARGIFVGTFVACAQIAGSGHVKTQRAIDVGYGDQAPLDRRLAERDQVAIIGDFQGKALAFVDEKSRRPQRRTPFYDCGRPSRAAPSGAHDAP